MRQPRPAADRPACGRLTAGEPRLATCHVRRRRLHARTRDYRASRDAALAADLVGTLFLTIVLTLCVLTLAACGRAAS